jgi:hypothetical protein
MTRTAIALLFSAALATSASAAGFELDANTIGCKDAKALSEVFKTADENEIFLKRNDIAMLGFIAEMAKAGCTLLPADTPIEFVLGGEKVAGLTQISAGGKYYFVSGDTKISAVERGRR